MMTPDPIVRDFDLELAASERQLLERARAFSRRVVAPAARQWEIDRRHPTEALAAACREGLVDIELPPEWGGAGCRFSAKMRIVEELAKDDFGFAFSLVNHHNALVRIARAGGPVAARLVPRMRRGEVIGCAAYTEPEHGSDLTHLTTRAARTTGGWTLSGVKTWITNGAVAGAFTTLAQTDPAAGSSGIATFIVEAEERGFVRLPPLDVAGAYSIGAGGFELRDYLAPDEALLDPPGEAFKNSLRGINGARCYVAAMCAGMLESAIDLAARHALDRQAFGRPLIEFQGLRWSLVDAATDLAALRLLAYRAARQIDAGDDAEEAAAAAKKFAGERTLPHLAACIQALGANGLLAEYPLMRHLVAAKAAGYSDGTTQIMNERLGKLLLRRHRKS